MRNTFSKAIVAGLAALSLSASSIATTEPASAAQWHGDGGGWHGGPGWRGGGPGWRGGYARWHRGYWHPGYSRGGVWYNGWWAPAVATGVLLGAAAAYPYYGYRYGYDSCWQNRPVYSEGGVYLGYQMVNVCQ
jgi:hypothetical protein